MWECLDTEKRKYNMCPGTNCHLVQAVTWTLLSFVWRPIYLADHSWVVSLSLHTEELPLTLLKELICIFILCIADPMDGCDHRHPLFCRAQTLVANKSLEKARAYLNQVP